MRTILLLALLIPVSVSCFGKRVSDAGLLRSAPLATRSEPPPRSLHTGIWNGDGMLVWGGMLDDSQATPEATGGAIYYPGSGKWYSLPSHSHESRFHHSAVWTGIQLIIWGGLEGKAAQATNTGLMFDIEDDAWLDVTTHGAPSARAGHSGVWTGDRMIIWGGENAQKQFGDGAIYDLVQDKWEALSDVDAPKPRAFHATVWTGKSMVIWGGRDRKGARNDGAVYNYVDKQWTSINTKNAPSKRYGHTAVWTGSKMIVWGGRGIDNQFLADGAIYDPKSDSWAPLPDSGLAPRDLHTATWTGKEMVIFGGQDQDGPQAVNGIFNLKKRSWRSFRLDSKYPPRYMHSAVWDDKQLIVWGGRGTDKMFIKKNTGLVISLEPSKAPKVVKTDDIESVGDQ